MTTDRRLTHQDVFAAVWHAMAEQGMPAYEDGTCFMRTPSEGLKCAIGCLLTDAEAAVMPNVRVTSDQFAVACPERFCDLNRNFLQEIQNAHDYSAQDTDEPLSTWLGRFQARMIKIANAYNLVIPEVLA